MSPQAPQGFGFLRAGAASLPVALANPAINAERVIKAVHDAHRDQVDLIVFPELTLTGVSTGNLALSVPLLESALEALDSVRSASNGLRPVIAVGLPLRIGGEVRSCAVWIHRGSYLGVVPEGVKAVPTPEVLLGEDAVPVGDVHLSVLDNPGAIIAARVGADVWDPAAAPGHATVVAALSGEPSYADSAARRADLLRARSEADQTAIVYSAPSFGESTNDLTWDGQTVIAEAGRVLAGGRLFSREEVLALADISIPELAQTNQTSASDLQPYVPTEEVFLGSAGASELIRFIEPFPWSVNRPLDVVTLQASALARRMESIGEPKLVIGVSGGLDSTLALLACYFAMDSLGRSPKDILGYTMPGFGTSKTTRESAEQLCDTLGVTFEELDIRPAAEAMLRALGHPYAAGEADYDVTFENVQAGLRTDYLFRLANLKGGLVVGTGDMSELALGWCTYGVGDQMSHYGVNAGIPKTVIQQVLAAVAEDESAPAPLRDVLNTILNTEISPELVPPSGGAPRQSTEAAIGPYELQDFTLYYVLRYGFGPRQILFLARQAWGERYSDQELVHWLKVFFSRFFANQFKREAAPNAPRIMQGGSLSPRTDWHMPSDAQVQVWLSELEALS